MSSTQLGKSITCWVRNWLTGRAYSKLGHIRPADSHQWASWGSVLGPVLFNTFIKYLDTEIESMLSTLLILPKEEKLWTSSEVERPYRDMDKTREVSNHQLYEIEQEQVLDFLPVMQ